MKVSYHIVSELERWNTNDSFFFFLPFVLENVLFMAICLFFFLFVFKSVNLWDISGKYITQSKLARDRWQLASLTLDKSSKIQDKCM